jgi:prophage regulatory protein
MYDTHSNPTTRLLRLPVVKERTGLCKTQIYELMKVGGFPQKIPLGSRAVCWLESEIEDWIDEKVSASRTGGSRA